jgi:hypothetical protein
MGTQSALARQTDGSVIKGFPKLSRGSEEQTFSSRKDKLEFLSNLRKKMQEDYGDRE